MDRRNIRIAITQGDINGIGYEVILKAFSDPQMLELCTPIIYGSPRIASYHSKALDINTNFTIIHSAEKALEKTLNIMNCNDEEVKVELGKVDVEAGKAAVEAIDKAISDYKEGFIDAIVTAPVSKENIRQKIENFSGHTEYIQEKINKDDIPLMIMMNDRIKIAILTTHIPLKDVSTAITKEQIVSKLEVINKCLKNDFGISRPKIAVLGLNPHCGENGSLGDEEQKVILPAIKEAEDKGIFCYGPFAADGLFGTDNYTHFDIILAMYHDQGMIPFKLLAMTDGVNYTAGLDLVRTSPAHGTAFDIAGKNCADESSMRNAVYTAIDIVRKRKENALLQSNVLRKHYYDKRDDSDKLNLSTSE